MKSKLLVVIGFLGVLLLIISVNALEQNIISIFQCAILSTLGLLIIFLSCHFAGVMSYQSCKTNRFKHDEKGKHRISKKYRKQIS